MEQRVVKCIAMEGCVTFRQKPSSMQAGIYHDLVSHTARRTRCPQMLQCLRRVKTNLRRSLRR